MRRPELKKEWGKLSPLEKQDVIHLVFACSLVSLYSQVTANAAGFRPPWDLGDAESIWPISIAETNVVQEWAAGRARLNSSRHEQQEALLSILPRKGQCPDLVSHLERRYIGSWVLKAYG